MKTCSSKKEQYLKLIHYYQSQDGIARTGILAKRLSLRRSSVTEMFQKLAKEHYVKYRPYLGVSLTEKGLKYVEYLQRKHRLLHGFLMKELQCSEAEIELILDELEHVDSELFFNRLEVYLEEKRTN
ncbi:metal-dependent transcriptional regulator [Enterococcus saccharolyticus]|uniref:metal-dependent transcriptional regulator n=1 Tax=Enterococcus TaxID=1350 RepID=UPI001E56B57B|nr:metal-dependent transcriptional regulator [Enterococcus saccharolyticus]MCD5002396.1 metal-dependent transcriptional regulator [Enterococcus saccharolyticus]